MVASMGWCSSPTVAEGSLIVTSVRNPLTLRRMFPPPRPSMAVIESLQASGSLPYDESAVYAVLSSSGIKQRVGVDGFCTTFCGWHSYYVASDGSNTFNIKYLFVGYSSDCDGCRNTYAK